MSEMSEANAQVLYYVSTLFFATVNIIAILVFVYCRGKGKK